VTIFLLAILAFGLFSPKGPTPVLLGNTSGDADLFTGRKPNVLIILDNSNSMDEDFYGNAVGSYATGSNPWKGNESSTPCQCLRQQHAVVS